MPDDIILGSHPANGSPRACSEETQSFGDFLRSLRLREERTIEEESKVAGIPCRYLEALEENDFDRLPPRIYVRGYLAAISRRYGLAADDLWNRFEEACRRHRQVREGSSETIFGIFSPPGEKFQWRDWSVPIGLAAAIILAALGSRFWSENRAVGTLPLSAEKPAVQEAPTIPGAPLPPPPPDQAAGPDDAGVRVVLRAEAMTSVSAVRDSGEREEWTMKAGETRTLSADTEIELSLGNAGVLRLNYNGRELGFIGDKGEVKRAIRFVREEKK